MSEGVWETVSRSVAETLAVGQRIGQCLAGGEIIGLVGELGTGKTHLIKGIAAGLGADWELGVTSPTFTLINEYEGRLRLYHVDAYRLKNAGQLEALGFDEMCSGEAVVVVEWAERVWSVMAEYGPIRIELAHRGATERGIRVVNVPERWGEEMT